MKSKMIGHIKADIKRHEDGAFSDLGKEFDSVKFDNFNDVDRLAWSFWDSWIDECRHGFPGFYKGIAKADWPKIGREVVLNLESNSPIKNDLVTKHFGPKKQKVT